jgi:hypothetical protein
MAALAAALLLSFAASAQTPTRIRGAIEALDGQMLTVKTREGPVVRIALADNVAVSAVVKVDPSAIAPNSYIGTATMAQPDGSYKALEVLVFPEAARGTAEGKFPWDLTPESTMINATVGTVAGVPQGRELMLTHKGETSKVVVPPDIPVVTFQPADRSLLVAGAPVFIGATRAADGSLSAPRVPVGKDGVAPPM